MDRRNREDHSTALRDHARPTISGGLKLERQLGRQEAAMEACASRYLVVVVDIVKLILEIEQRILAQVVAHPKGRPSIAGISGASIAGRSGKVSDKRVLVLREQV